MSFDISISDRVRFIFVGDSLSTLFVVPKSFMSILDSPKGLSLPVILRKGLTIYAECCISELLANWFFLASCSYVISENTLESDIIRMDSGSVCFFLKSSRFLLDSSIFLVGTIFCYL